MKLLMALRIQSYARSNIVLPSNALDISLTFFSRNTHVLTSNMIRTSTSPSHRQVAAELNNMGVILHECEEKTYEAAEAYEAALKLMLQSVEPNACKKEGSMMRKNITSTLQSLQLTLLQSRTISSLPIPAEFRADGESRNHFEILNFSNPLAINLSESQMDQDAAVSAVIIYNFALFHFQQGKLQSAAQLFHMALSQSFEDHVITAPTWVMLHVSVHHNLGLIYSQQGRYAQSGQHLMVALRLGNEAFGINLLTAATLSSLGGVFLAGGDLQKAMMAFDSASNIYDHHEVENVSMQSDMVVAPAA